MSRRVAKIKALRIATALLNASAADGYEGISTEAEAEMILEELHKLASSLGRRAEKLGGSFNEFSGIEIKTQ